MADSLETQKEKAIKLLDELKNRVNRVQGSITTQQLSTSQYYDYDEIISLLNIYFLNFRITNSTLKATLNNMPLRPISGTIAKRAYEDINKIIVSAIDEVRSSFEFSMNPEADSLKITVSRPYLQYLKTGAVRTQLLEGEITDLNDKIRQASDDKTSLEKELIALQSENHDTNGKLISFETNLNKAAEAQSLAEARAEALSSEISALNTELRHFKEQAQKTEVARNSTNFHNQANTNNRAAKLWGAAALITIIVFVFIIYFIFSKSGELFQIAKELTESSQSTGGALKPVDNNLMHQIILVEIAKRVSARVLMMSVIIYLITFLVKNYNAQMHNYIINSHKANALRSTVDLIGTAKQDDGNDKIIIQATQAIFTPQKSGYQGVESEPTSPNLITNVVDAVTKKG